MEQLNSFFGFFKTLQKVLKIKDSIAVSLFSGLIGTLVMDISNLAFWRTKKTETLYAHIAGSVYVRPFRTNQRKNFWLGQITHFITGTTLAYPLNYIFIKTGKDHPLLKGAMFGAITWELIYGLGQRFEIFSSKPHKTETHYAELFNNILYGVATAQSLVAFSDPSILPDTQSKATTQDTQGSRIQPIYSDVNLNVENSLIH